MSPLDLLEMQASVPEVNPPFLEVCFDFSANFCEAQNIFIFGC